MIWSTCSMMILRRMLQALAELAASSMAEGDKCSRMQAILHVFRTPGRHMLLMTGLPRCSGMNVQHGRV